MGESRSLLVQQQKPIVRHISFLITLFVDSSLSLFSMQVVLSYLGNSPYGTSWGMILTGTQTTVIYLLLACLGFVFYWQILRQVKNDLYENDFMTKSPRELMILFGMPFVFLVGFLAFVCDFSGIGLPFYPTSSMLYGFGFGMVIVRFLFGLKHMKNWRITPVVEESDSQRKRVSYWKITNQLVVSHT